MKIGKELKINNFKNYNIVYGSVNNKHPKAIYINISAWVQPLNEEETNYSRVIRNINKNIKQSLFNDLNNDKDSDFIKDRTIVDLDIRESGVKYGKRSFMNCEITLFLKTEISVTSDKNKVILDEIVNSVINSSFEDSKHFKFYKKKN